MHMALLGMLLVVAEPVQEPRLGCVIVVTEGVLAADEAHRVEEAGARGLRSAGRLARVVQGTELDLMLPPSAMEELRACPTDACRAALLRPVGMDVTVLVTLRPIPGKVVAETRWFDVRASSTIKTAEATVTDAAFAAEAVEHAVRTMAEDVLGAAPALATPQPATRTVTTTPETHASLGARVARVAGGVLPGVGVASVLVALLGGLASATTYGVFALVPGFDRMRTPMQAAVFAGAGLSVVAASAALAAALCATGVSWVSAWL